MCTKQRVFMGFLSKYVHDKLGFVNRDVSQFVYVKLEKIHNTICCSVTANHITLLRFRVFSEGCTRCTHVTHICGVCTSHIHLGEVSAK